MSGGQVRQLRSQGAAAPASATAVELIRSAIIEGRLAPSTRLKEEHLAREFGISRTPVREALRTLQSEGLVDAEPNRGSAVREYSTDDIREMYELRAVLEGHAARRAATHMTAAQLGGLRASCARFAELAAGERGAEYAQRLVRENAVFHGVILDAAESDRLRAMVRQVTALPLSFQSYLSYSPGQAQQSATAHEGLVEAFASHDADRAEALMFIHVTQARDVLISWIEGRRG